MPFCRATLWVMVIVRTIIKPYLKWWSGSGPYGISQHRFYTNVSYCFCYDFLFLEKILQSWVGTALLSVLTALGLFECLTKFLLVEFGALVVRRSSVLSRILNCFQYDTKCLFRMVALDDTHLRGQVYCVLVLHQVKLIADVDFRQVGFLK